ncbi:hypothetical protein LINPERHAP2_LOCUS4635 [Linum perenne]
MVLGCMNVLLWDSNLIAIQQIHRPDPEINRKLQEPSTSPLPKQQILRLFTCRDRKPKQGKDLRPRRKLTRRSNPCLVQLPIGDGHSESGEEQARRSSAGGTVRAAEDCESVALG